MKKKIISIFLFLIIPLCHADFIKHHEQGWSWYAEVKNKSFNKNLDPTEEMHQLKKQVKNSLDLAIFDPTTKNVENYLELQNALSKRASIFATQWQRVLWENPLLDYSISHPTNSEGRFTFFDELNQKKLSAVEKLSKEYGLFFFFRGDCPYCHRFAPILKHFSEIYRLTVIPISLDGGELSDYLHPKRDQGQAKQLKVQVVPSVFAVSPRTKKVIPIASGLVSEDVLLERVYRLSK